MQETDIVQDFPFDGVYARAVTRKAEDVRRDVNRQPKRRGLLACFIQPLADEPAATCPSRSTPSRLTLKAEQLWYQRAGSPDLVCLPLSDVRDVQYKWLQTGGVRVSKVTITLVSGVEPVVIRGLKNPEDLVDAVRRQQQPTAEHRSRLMREQAEGLPCGGVGASALGGGSDVTASPSMRVAPWAASAEATSSPASGATRGCGSMTLHSAFARCPAQAFAGAEDVAQEVLRASPGQKRSSSDSSSQASETPNSASLHSDDAQRTQGPGLGGQSAPGGPRAAVQAAPPPVQPSDSYAISLTLSLADMVQPQPQPQTLRHRANSISVQPEEPAAAAGAWRSQGSLRNGGSGSDVSSQLPPEELARDAVHFVGGSPPPRPEDSLIEGQCVAGPVHGSHELQHFTGGNPPPVPEDSVMYGGLATPLSMRSSKSVADRDVPLSQRSSAASRAMVLAGGVLLPALHAARSVDGDGNALSRSVSAALPMSAASTPAGHSSPPQACPEASFASRTAAGSTRGSSVIALEPPSPTAAVGSGGSGSPAMTPRLMPALPKQQHQLSHSSLLQQPLGVPVGVPISVESAPSRPNGPSDGGCSSYRTASSGEPANSSGGATPTAEAAAAAGACIPDSVQDASSKGFTPMGVFGIAAAAATLSAALTSAASAGMGSGARLASPPQLPGTAGMEPGSSASASVTAPPLTLVGLTAAAAATLLTAAAVTHIRTGSPLRPRKGPGKAVDESEAQENAAPSLMDDTGAGVVVKADDPAGRGSSHGCTVARSWRTSGSGASVEGGGVSSANAPHPNGLVHEALVIAAPVLENERDVDKPVSAAALVECAVPPGHTPAPGLASEGSSGAAEAHMAPGGASPPASRNATVASGVTADCGDGSEDAATSDAWGSHRTLVDCDPEPAVPSSQTTTAPPELSGLPLHELAGGGAGDLALGAELAEQHLQHREQMEALPAMLSSAAPGCMPQMMGRSAGTSDAPSQQQEEEYSLDCSSVNSTAPAESTEGGCGSAPVQPVGGMVHGGELQPPPLRRTPHQASAVRQLFPRDHAAAAGLAAADNSDLHPQQHLHPQHRQQELESYSVTLVAESPVAAAPAEERGAAPPAARRLRLQQLAESPVRVLYSLDAAVMDLPVDNSRVLAEQSCVTVAAMAAVSKAAPLPPAYRAESGMLTDETVAQSALQTEAVGAVVFEGLDSDSAGDSSTISGRAPAAAPQLLAESAAQQALAADRPEAGGTNYMPSVAFDSEGADASASPQQAGNHVQDTNYPGGGPRASGVERVPPSGECARLDPSAGSSAFGDASPPRSTSDDPSPLSISAAPAQARLSSLDDHRHGEDLLLAAGLKGANSSLGRDDTPLLGAGAVGSDLGAGPLLEEGRELLAVVEPTGLLARSRSESQMESSSTFSGASGSSPESASVGSGPYMRIASAASSSDACGAGGSSPRPTDVGRRRADSANTTPRSSDNAEGAHGDSSSAGRSSTVGDALDGQGVEPHQQLLEPDESLSADPLVPWPRSIAAVAALSGNENSIGTITTTTTTWQDDGTGHDARDASSASAEPASLLNVLNDAADDMEWLLGPAGGHLGASAPDSPHIPLPPTLARHIAASRGSSSRRGTADTQGSNAKTTARVVETCSSRSSSSGSCEAQADTLHVRPSRASPRASAAGHSHPPCTEQTWSSCDGNQLATPPSSQACGSAAGPSAAADDMLELHLSDRSCRSSSSSNRSARFSGSRSSSHSRGREHRSASAAAAAAPDDVGSPDSAADSAAAGNAAPLICCSPSRQRLSVATVSKGTPVSPDLSDISSAIYGGAMYEHSSPGGHQASDGAGAEAGAQTDGAACLGGDDLFQNPLYSARGKTSPEPQVLSRLHYDSSSGGGGLIAWPHLMSRARKTFGGLDGSGYSTSAYSPCREQPSASQASAGGESMPSAGRRRTREETATSSYRLDDGGGSSGDLRSYVSARGVGPNDAWRVAVADAISRLASAKGARACSKAPVATGARGGERKVLAAEDSGAADSSDGGTAAAAAQPTKRARTILTGAQEPASTSLEPPQISVWHLQQRHLSPLGQQQLSKPIPPHGNGGGPALASPLMVLNPAYVRSAASAGASPVAASPPGATSDDVAAARTDAMQRDSPASANVDAVGAIVTVVNANLEVVARDDDTGAAAVQDGDADQRGPQHITPRLRDSAQQLQETEWDSVQGSPSNHQAAHAAALLRHANDAVDFAREAVQRGDAEWLLRVTATLQAVQSALDALRDF